MGTRGTEPWVSGRAGGVKKTYKKLYFSGGAGIPNWFGIPMVALVFSVDLVFKEELNIMLEILDF